MLKGNKEIKKNYETMSAGGKNQSQARKHNDNKIIKGPKSSIMDEDDWMGSLGWYFLSIKNKLQS